MTSMPSNGDPVRAAININIHDLGAAQRELTVLEKERDDELASVRNSYADRIEALAQRIASLGDAIYHQAQPARDALCPGDTKQAELPAGCVGWRKDPPKVNVRGMDAVIEALRGAGLTRFLRLKEEINKDAILVEPEAISGIKGLTVSRSERFWVQPHDTKSEQTRLVKAIKAGGRR